MTVPELLLVDDDADTREEMADLIASLGLTCHSAPDVESALKFASRNPSIGIVVTDIHMPGSDGLSLIRMLKEQGSSLDLPEALVITGFPEIEKAVAALRLGAIDFLEKPVSRSVLRSALGHAINRWQRRQRAAASYRELDGTIKRLVSDMALLAQTSVADQPDPNDRTRRGDRRRSSVTSARNPADLKRLARARRIRERYFDPGLFADPTWEMLLELAISDLEDNKVTVTSLCAAASVPYATAYRRVTQMIDNGMLIRLPDSEDRRRVHIVMTPETREKLNRVLDELISSGLPV